MEVYLINIGFDEKEYEAYLCKWSVEMNNYCEQIVEVFLFAQELFGCVEESVIECAGDSDMPKLHSFRLERYVLEVLYQLVTIMI